MSDELELKLIKKYPKLFRDYNADDTVSPMALGFCCGNGWFDILDRLCSKIQEHIDKNNLQQVIVDQVKEKFGGLRFYYSYGDDTIHKFVNDAEKEADMTCEYCGTTENVGNTYSGWITTMCYNDWIKSNAKSFRVGNTLYVRDKEGNISEETRK